MSDDERKNVKVRFAPGETGWGLEVEPGRILINNIPYADRLNIDDLVETDPAATGLREIKRVLKRTFHGKTAFDYPVPHTDNYKKLHTAWHAAGMKCEGLLPGLVIVAHHKDQDPVKVASDAGVTVTLHDPQPDLEPLPA